MTSNLLKVLFLGALISSHGKSAFAEGSQPNNKQLTIGISQEFENLNPMIMSMSASTYLSYMVTRNMVVLNPDGKWVTQLAKQIPSLENKKAKLMPDKTFVATWELIDNAKWGDGQPITCADLKFAWEIGLNENVSVPSREAYTDIKAIDWDAKTPKKCVFTYNQAKWDFYKNMPTPMPKHIEEPILKQYGSTKEGYDTNSNYNKMATNPGLYNGPYKIAEMKLGSHIVFVKNPEFYGTPAKIEKIVVKMIPNTGTLEANLFSGTIDMIASLGVSFDQALTMDKKMRSENKPFNVLFKPSLVYEHIDLNLDNPILADVRVRKAISYAIDRKAIVNSMFEGKEKIALHNKVDIDSWYTDDPKKITIYNFDKKKAAQLLDEAGWKKSAEGTRVKNGQKLSLQIMTTAGNKARETIQTLMQGQLHEVGIELVIKNEPARVFFGETLHKRSFGAMAMFAWTSSPESSEKSILHSKNIVSKENNWAGQNYTGWKNAKVDKLIDAIDLEFNANKRKQMAQEVLKYYTDEVPVIPLYYRSDIAVNPKNLTNFRLPGHMFAETNNVEDWNLIETAKK